VTFDAGRLRRGELIAGGGGIVLLLAIFALPWFEVTSASGASTSLSGWQSLTDIRWVLLIAIAISSALLVATWARRSPAVPVTLSMISTVLGAVAVLCILFRIIDHPSLASASASATAAVTVKPGIYVGLAAALVVAYGSYRSLRTEGSTFGDPASVETVLPGRVRADAEAKGP
jgi:undecaprenyl pyrophosphate phosphatase UppP